MPWIAAIAVGAGIGNYLANKSANDRAQMVQDQQFQKWLDINVPDPAEQTMVLKKFVSTGEMAPVMQQAIAQAPSEFEKIVASSEQTAAQNRALSELSKIGYDGGLRLQDKAALQDARIGSIAREKAGRQGIVDEMGRRGLSGSGYDVAAQLAGQQGGADREANASLKIASDAQDRALRSIMGAGELAGKMKSQDFEQKAAKASAADRINAFNTANLRDVNASNVSAQNAANEYNLKNTQRISDQNTSLSNSQDLYNKGLVQQNYENQLKKLAGATGQAQGVAATEQRGGAILGNTISNIGGAASNYALMDRYFKSQPNSASGSGYQMPSNLQASIDKVKDEEEDDYYS